MDETVPQLQETWLKTMSEFELKGIRARAKRRARRLGYHLSEPPDGNYRENEYKLLESNGHALATANILLIDDLLGYQLALRT